MATSHAITLTGGQRNSYPLQAGDQFYLSQIKYILDILERAFMQDSEPLPTHQCMTKGFLLIF